MKIKANLIVLTVDYNKGITYILSDSDTEIKPPYIEINNSNKSTLTNEINRLLLGRLPKINEIEMRPMITSHHNSLLDEDENELNMVFSFLVTFVETSGPHYWIEIEWKKPHRLHSLLFETAQRLK